MKSISLSIAIGLLAAFNSCVTPEDPIVGVPPELITRVLLTFTDGEDTVVASYEDVDGPAGPAQPVIVPAVLKESLAFTVKVRLFQTKPGLMDSVIELTDEIRRLSAQHQFFYEIGNDKLFGLRGLDQDDNNLPLGLTFALYTSSIMGDREAPLKIVLSHYRQLGMKNGTDRAIDSDIEISIPIDVRD